MKERDLNVKLGDKNCTYGSRCLSTNKQITGRHMRYRDEQIKTVQMKNTQPERMSSGGKNFGRALSSWTAMRASEWIEVK